MSGIFQRLSMENIEHQRDSFGKDLELVLTEAQSRYLAKKDKADYGDLRVRLEVLIYSRLGIKTKIDLDAKTEGAIMPFFLNPNHILLKEFFRGDIEDIDSLQAALVKTLGSKAKGTVDLKTAKLTGMFSEYEHPLWLGLNVNFGHGMTPGEITAILLHELGHGFTYYEYSNRLVSTNQVLCEYLSASIGKKNPSKRTYALKELEKYGAITEEEFDSMAGDPETVFSNAMFLRYIRKVVTSLPNRRYDETSSEQLADNFANRFGYGKELITGLDRLYRGVMFIGSPEKSYTMRAIFYMYEIFTTYAVLKLAVILTLNVGRLVLAQGIGGIYTLFSVYMAMIGWWSVTGADNEDMTYDKLKLRYTRIRSEMITTLKNPNVDKATSERVVKAISEIDPIIKNTMIHNNLLTMAKNFLLPVHRNTSSAIALQQQLEILASNDLFVKAAELKSLEK